MTNPGMVNIRKRFGNTKQGMLAASCYMHILATRGDAGHKVTLDDINTNEFFGEPRLANFLMGSQIYYEGHRVTIEDIITDKEAGTKTVNMIGLQRDGVTLRKYAHTLRTESHARPIP